MLKRFLTTLSLVVAVLGLASGAQAQYMKIVTDNPTDNTKMRASGTTLLTITLNTNTDKNGSPQSCNSHTNANGCGSILTGQPLDMFGYTLLLHAVGGTVSFGTYTPADVAYTPLQAQLNDSQDFEVVFSRSVGVTLAGLSTLGTVPVTIATGSPRVDIVQTIALDPFAVPTAFNGPCDGFFNPNTYTLGTSADLCGDLTGFSADWLDADGAGAPAVPNAQPIVTAPSTASGTEGVVLAAINASATDADATNTLTITQSGKPADLTFTTNSPGVSPRTASITGTPGFTDAGVFNIIWTVNDGTGTGNATNSATTVLTIANTNRAPTLNQPANMSVAQGATSDQVITGTDPDGDALTFSKVAGPTFMTVTTTNGTTGNIHLAAGASEPVGTSAATVRATDTGALTNDKTLTITVTPTNRPPVLTQPVNMTVNEGVTADQVLNATDPDLNPLTFTLVSGPTYASVTTTTAGAGTATGNLHLAPGFSDAGTASATARASDGTLTNDKSLTITVNNVNRAPTLNQPANMTVAQGLTSDQVITGTDPDGDALTFSKVAGPTFMTVTTTNATTGNIHLAAGAAEPVGTSAATVQASDGSLTNSKTLTITVTPTNRPPVLTQPVNMTVNEGVTADQVLNATDPDLNPLTFTLVSGPTYASVTTTTAGAGTATGNLHLAPGFSDAGTAAATVRASDGSLNNDKSLTITVNNVNRAPTLNQPTNMTVNEGVTADQVITGTDPDGDALTFTKTAGPTYLTVTTTNGTTGNIHLAPGFTDAGTAAATVTATDTGALTNSKTLTVTVVNVNRAPTLNQPANMTVNEGVTADQVITGTDPDGDALTFSLVSGPTYASVTTTNATTGNIHLAPGFSDAGTASATARASDGSLTNDKSFTITVNNVNRAPTLNQPANMSVAQGLTSDQVITGTDPDGDALTFSKVAGPTFMTVTTTNATTGNIHLAAGVAEPVGTSAATVQASDGSLTNSKTLTITVTPTNRPPVLTQPVNMTVNEGVTADQVLNATDPDLNPLTFTLVSGPTYASVTTTTAGAGTATGNIHLAPGFSDAGTASATVRASDGSLTNDKSLTITVNNVNRAPTLNQPVNMTVNEGVTADQVITGTDPDGDALTFTKTAGPTYLTVTTTNGTTGNIHLAPGFSDAGTAAATVTATDTGALTNSKTLTVTVVNVNRAPTLNQPTNMTVNEGVTADQVITGTDPDGDALTFSLVSGPTYASVTTTNATTGNIHLAPGFSDAGTAAATARASDGSLTNDKSFTITVNNVNRAPTLNQPANMSVAQGLTSDQVITGTDPDGDALTFSKVAGPTFMTVTTTNATTGNIHLAAGASEPVGTSAATVRATDTGALTNDKTLTITVTPTNRPPVLTQPANMTVNEGATADQVLNATDPDLNPLTFTLVSGPTYASVTTTTAGAGTATGNIHLAPGFSDAGTAAATVRASDGSLTNDKSLTITVNNTNRAPTLNQPANMTVNENATADQVITGTDPDGDALTFSKTAGPTYLTVTTTNGTTGNIHLAPGFTDAGTAAATVRATDTGALFNEKSLTVTVNNTNRAPTLNQPANMTVNEGVTADQVITGTDPDGDALTFSLVSGPTYASVTTTNATTGNIHLAPGFSDAGTAAATVRATDTGALTNDKSLTITVNNVDRPVVLGAIGNMTVVAGLTADQAISATDPDADAITFTSTGPVFLTRTDNAQVATTRTGNIHLAPSSVTSGTFSASVTATANATTSTQNFTINVTATNNPPTLAQPVNMTVNEGATADQVLNATDPDLNPLTFTLVSGPTYASVTTTTPGAGTATGNLHLAPGFSDAGTAAATVRASDGSATNDKSLTITVNNTNRAPVLTQPANMTVNEGVTADQVLNATDADGQALTFSLVSGPTYASVTTTTPGTGTATGNLHLAPGFSDAGTAAATVRASDGALNNDKSLTITVNNVNRAPTLNQPANMTVNEGVTADQVITGTDPDGDALTFSLVSGPTYASVTTTNATTGNIHLAPGFSDAGTAAATARASDGSLTNDKSFTITVNNVNRAPTLNQPTNMSVAQSGTSDQVITGTDPDGDALTFTKVAGPTFMTVTTTNATTGNIHLAAGASEPVGTSAATVQASDGSLTNSKTLTITVTPTNRPPVLTQPANMTVNEGATADQVLNATDPDLNPLTFTLVSGPTYASVTTTTAGAGTATGNIHLAPGFSDAGAAAATVRASDGSLTNDKSLTITVNNTNRAPTLNQPANMSVAQGATSDQVISGTDPDGDALTFTKVAGPTFMTVTTTTGTTGNIHLAAGAAEPVGTSAATVQASDGSLTNSKTLTITVTPTNRPPVLTQPVNMTVNEGATADQVLNATDPDGNALAFSLVSGPTYASVTTTTPGAGTATGNIHLAPGFSDAGTAAATVRASDGSATNDKSLTITVNNVNRAPTLNQPANMTVNEGATADQVITGTDPDGDALTFSLVAGPTFTSVTTTNATTGNIHLAPGFSDAGAFGATVRASDGSLTNDKTLTITVNNTNRAPTLNQPANMTVNEGVTADQAITGSDPDGDALSFTKVSGPTYLTVSTTNATTGNIHLAPGFSDAGTAAATVQASDGTLSNSKSLTVTVNNVNRAPTLNQPTNMTVAQGNTSDQAISGTDPDGDALTFSKVSGPTFMTVTTTTGTTGNIHLAAGASEPIGTSAATVRASDGSLNNDKSLTITVTPTNRAPVLTQPVNMTVNEGVTADQVLNATDPDANPLTFSLASGPSYASVTTTTPGAGTATGNIHLAPGFSDAGTALASVQVSDGSLLDSKSLTITVNNVDRAPTLNQPANMTVNEGATADQTITGTDPDGDALTFTKSAGPTFVTVTTTNPTTGNIHAAPGFSDAGVYGVTVTASDGSLNNVKALTVTVNNVDRAPVLAAIANQTVAEGATADVAVSATDADGDVITLSATLPSFATLTSVPAAGTVNGSIHIAPNFGDAAGSPYSATVTASSGSPVLTNTKNFTITVTTGANRPPVLVQPSNMTVDEGMTADQTLTASDPDGNPLTFTKVSGPLFLTVTTTSSTMGNAHLAPGFSDAGTYTAVVRATDPGSLFDQKSFSITVNNVNRAPVANADGPYSGTVGVPVSFNGTGSTDPDGDALTYAWDFGDVSTGSGATPNHTYAATGVFTVSLTVTDNGTPNLSNTATSLATITNELPALVFKSQAGIIKPRTGKPFYCYEIQPVDGDYANTDVNLSSITMTFGGKTVLADASKTSVDSDKNLDGIQEIKTCFSKANVQFLFAGLPTGLNLVALTIQGDLVTGGKFSGTVMDTVRITGSGSAFEASVSPNPLNPVTKLYFTTSKPGTVKVDMFDLQGRLVRTIQSTTYMMAGDHALMIDGRGQSGEKLASGVYFIRGETADGIFKNMITILK